MTNKELIDNWLSVFGAGVDKSIMEEHVTSECNFLWHLFTWGEVSCLKENEARAAFDKLQYSEAIKFYDGYCMDIDGVSVTGKVTAKELEDEAGDVYIVAKDFSWTYVKTHEHSCGPYFCKLVDYYARENDNAML